jgi:hypothetical protein
MLADFNGSLGSTRLVLDDGRRLVPELVVAIDHFLSGRMAGAAIADWADDLVRTYTIPADLALIGATLHALSILRYPQSTIDQTSKGLLALKAALEGRDEFVIRYRCVPGEVVARRKVS